MIDELNDKIKCEICGLEEYICAMNTHILKDHYMESDQYINKYYGVPLLEHHNKKLGCSEAIFISKVRKLYPQFDNDLKLFQYLYDTNGCSYKKLIKNFQYPKIQKICQCLNIKLNYNLTKEHKEKISKQCKGKTLTKERKEKISKGYHNLSDEKKQEISKKISDSNSGKTYFRDSIEKMIKNKKESKHPYRGKGGFRDDLNHYVRSSWEANYARILKYLKIDYQFEPDII